MTNSGQHRLARISWLRATLALVLFVMASLQPGMVAMAKSAMHPGIVGTVTIETHSHDSDGHVHGVETLAQEDGDGLGSHHNDPKTADVCCDTHCAPSHAVPVGFPPFPLPSSGVLALGASAAVMPGETANFIRPPRS